MEAGDDADAIAAVVIQQFDKLPAKRKPCIRDNGVHEWVPLSGIVAKNRVTGSLTCLSLATGMKCLPASKLPEANGVAIHDWHAEILAIRAFNHFIMQECRSIAFGKPSDFLVWRNEVAGPSSCDSQPLTWREDIALHMYCSEAPCGDASMELTMAAQEDASPWPLSSSPPPPGDNNNNTTAVLPGRAYFSELGIVRRKPARADAPPSLSKSCSDKLALKQCTSLLASLATALVSPRGVYLSSVVLPASQFSASACERCFSSRMRSLAGKRWDEGGYAFVPFAVVATSTTEFAFSKRAVAARAAEGKTVASNLAVVWSRGGLEEGLVGGVLQGSKQFDVRGASSVSRRKMWRLLSELVVDETETRLRRSLCPDTETSVRSAKVYRDIKEADFLAVRRAVKADARKEALKGWIRNTGDDDFNL